MMRKMMMPAFGLALACGMVGCGGDSAESVMGDSLKLQGQVCDILESVKDEDSAKAAQGKLDALAPKFEEIKKRMKAVGEPKPEDQAKLLTKFGPEMGKLMERAMKTMDTAQKYKLKVPEMKGM